MIRFPVLLRISTGTGCQLKCPACPVPQKKVDHHLGTGSLSFADFKTIIDRNPRIRFAELAHWGELFLNRDLVRIMEYAYAKKVKLFVGGVNFNYAPDDMLEAMVKYRFHNLVVAVDGVTQETYEKYRVGGKLDRVLRHIETLNRFKRQYRSPLPRLLWQYTLFDHNHHEVSAAKALARRFRMRFFINPSWNDLVLKAGEETAAPASGQPQPRIEHSGCAQLWSNPQVNYDGRVLGCCHNYWGDFGNALEQGLPEVLSGEKMRYARAMVRGKAPERQDIPCTQCHFYQNMKADNRWLKKSFIYRDALYWWILLRLNISPRMAGSLYRVIRQKIRRVLSMAALSTQPIGKTGGT